MVTSCRVRQARFSVALALTAELLLLCVCARHLACSHQRRLLISSCSFAFSVTRAAVNCSQLPRSWRLSLFDV